MRNSKSFTSACGGGGEGSHQHVKNWQRKCTGLKTDVLQALKMFPLPVFVCGLLSPKYLRAGAVKGLWSQF